MCGATVRAFSECITAVDVSLQDFPGSVEFKRVVHLVVEALAQHSALLLQHHEAVISHLLPALVQAALRDDDGAAASGMELAVSISTKSS